MMLFTQHLENLQTEGIAQCPLEPLFIAQVRYHLAPKPLLDAGIFKSLDHLSCADFRGYRSLEVWSVILENCHRALQPLNILRGHY